MKGKTKNPPSPEVAKKLQASKVPPASPPLAASDGPVKILLVDDHPLMRRGIRTLIEQHPHYTVCGEAENAPKALELMRKFTPALGIVDITLSSTNGIELIKNMLAQQPALRVLVLSMHPEEIYAERALRAGAGGYLMKHEAAERLIDALKRIQEGDIYVSDQLKERLLHRFVNHGGAESVSPIDTLSDREMEVFQLIGNGYGTQEIAGQLKLSAKTIDSYREHLKMKLNLNSSAELLRYAIQWAQSQPRA